MIGQKFHALPGYMAPAQHTTMKESPYDKALAEIGAEKFALYKRDVVPIENRFIAGTRRLDNPVTMARVADMAQSGIKEQYAPMMRQKLDQEAQMGAGASSGRGLMQRTALGNAGATASGTAAFGARTGLRDTKIRGLENIIGIGNEQGSQAQTALADVANTSSALAKQRAVNNWEGAQAANTALGNMAGLGVGYALNQRRPAAA